MSSRIVRSGGPSVAAPHVFRSVFSLSSRPVPRSSAGAQPGMEVATSVTQEDIDSRIAAVRKQAHAEGEAQGAKQAAAKFDSVIQDFARLLEDLASQRKRLRAEAEEDTVKLALAIARRVLHREIATDPEAMHGLVKAAFAKLNARDIHRVRVSPPYANMLETYREKLNVPHAVAIIPDATLPLGSAVFETVRGEMDASIDTQLSEIDRGLTDMLRRRSR